jgi:hypothetical protein
MKLTTKKSVMLLVLLFAFFSSNADNKMSGQSDKDNTELKNAYDLAKRVLEGRAANFVFQLRFFKRFF